MTKTITYHCNACHKEIEQPFLKLVWTLINPMDNESHYCEDCGHKITEAIRKINKKP